MKLVFILSITIYTMQPSTGDLLYEEMEVEQPYATMRECENDKIKAAIEISKRKKFVGISMSCVPVPEGERT